MHQVAFFNPQWSIPKWGNTEQEIQVPFSSEPSLQSSKPSQMTLASRHVVPHFSISPGQVHLAQLTSIGSSFPAHDASQICSTAVQMPATPKSEFYSSRESGVCVGGVGTCWRKGKTFSKTSTLHGSCMRVGCSMKNNPHRLILNIKKNKNNDNLTPDALKPLSACPVGIATCFIFARRTVLVTVTKHIKS